MSTPVIVLLADGRQYEQPLAVRRIARLLASQGVTIYSIGLGSDVDGALLTELAGDPARYYFAPGPDELAGIYSGIAARIPCVAEDYRGRRCP